MIYTVTYLVGFVLVLFAGVLFLRTEGYTHNTEDEGALVLLVSVLWPAVFVLMPIALVLVVFSALSKGITALLNYRRN